MDSAAGLLGMTPAGLPHSEIPGSKPVCGSPRLFAAYYVLHRRSAPRHPPFTLSSLTTQTRKHLCVQRSQMNPNELSKNFSRDPVGPRRHAAGVTARTDAELVELIGLEPTTSALQGRRSPKLSYCPCRRAARLLDGGPKWI